MTRRGRQYPGGINLHGVIETEAIKHVRRLCWCRSAGDLSCRYRPINADDDLAISGDVRYRAKAVLIGTFSGKCLMSRHFSRHFSCLTLLWNSG